MGVKQQNIANRDDRFEVGLDSVFEKCESISIRQDM